MAVILNSIWPVYMTPAAFAMATIRDSGAIGQSMFSKGWLGNMGDTSRSQTI